LCESQNTVVNNHKVPCDEARPSYQSTTSYYTNSNVLAFLMRILTGLNQKAPSGFKRSAILIIRLHK